MSSLTETNRFRTPDQLRFGEYFFRFACTFWADLFQEVPRPLLVSGAWVFPPLLLVACVIEGTAWPAVGISMLLLLLSGYFYILFYHSSKEDHRLERWAYEVEHPTHLQTRCGISRVKDVRWNAIEHRFEADLENQGWVPSSLTYYLTEDQELDVLLEENL